MEKMEITKKMVREGYEKGIITVVDDASKYGCDGVCCMIEDNAFYLGSIRTDVNAEQYIREIGVDELINKIYNTLNECIKEEFVDEYGLYYLILRENGICNEC